MADVVKRVMIKGNKDNWRREAQIEVYEGGYVRVQQSGSPVVG